MAVASTAIATAADLTSSFNELLRERNAPPTRQAVTLDAIDGFLKEAYRIVGLSHCFEILTVS
jgi:hypothetical protein